MVTGRGAVESRQKWSAVPHTWPGQVSWNGHLSCGSRAKAEPETGARGCVKSGAKEIGTKPRWEPKPKPDRQPAGGSGQAALN